MPTQTTRSAQYLFCPVPGSAAPRATLAKPSLSSLPHICSRLPCNSTLPSGNNTAARDSGVSPHAISSPAVYPPTCLLHVALTREVGKNDALRNALSGDPSINAVELPCVETVPGPDRDQLPSVLQNKEWAWVVITSPEAASVLSVAWDRAGKPPLRVAAVGGATAAHLTSRGLPVSFTPRKATGRTLVSEFPAPPPADPPSGRAVLYPASVLASDTVPDGLAMKGYVVRRLDTYSTEQAVWTEEQRALAGKMDIVTFAAPSAVRGWVRNAGLDVQMPVACIGETSRNAALAAGFRQDRVFCPEKPGVAAWAQSVLDACVSLDAC